MFLPACLLGPIPHPNQHHVQVDSAKAYRNEAETAEAIANSGVDRSQVFYTSKVPSSCMSYDKAKRAIEESLAAAQKLGYIDLYSSLPSIQIIGVELTNPRMLIHSPYGGKDGRLGAWRALVEAQQQTGGKIRSIGVSNYGIRHLNELEEYIKAGGGGRIAVGQYELHPWCAREEIAAWLQERGAVVEAYSPLVQATRMEEPVLQALVKKHGKTPAQVLLRWSLQKVGLGLVVVERDC